MTEKKKRKFFSGSSLEAALVAAASEYGIPVDEVAYETVEKKHGFLRVRRNVVIKVDPESPRRAETAPPAVEPEPAGRRMPPPPPRQQEEAEEPEPEPEEEAQAEEAEEPEDVEAAEPAAEAEEAEEEKDEEEEITPVPPPGGRRRRRAARPEPEPEPEAEEEPEEPEEPEEEDEEDEEEEDRGGRRRGRRRRRRAAPRPMEPKPIPPIEKRLKKAKGKLGDGALEATEWLLDLLDLDVDPEVYQGDDRLEVELRGDDRDMLIDEEGKVLSALEHLIPRVMHGVIGETSAIRADSENFQEGREERLRQKAMQLAFEVRENGKAEVLEPMDPADRRIVHLAVNDEAGVSTKSLGGGFYKRVKIYPD